MKNKHVEYIVTETSGQTKLQALKLSKETKYKFTEKAGSWVLQRFCFWILYKLGCHVVEIPEPIYKTEITHKRIVISASELSDFIYRQKITIAHFMKTEIDRILIGEEMFHGLKEGYYIGCPLELHSDTIKIYSVDIQVIHGLKELVIVPKLPKRQPIDR